jgi:hypothetical protein
VGKKGWVSAEELMAQLEADPKWLAERKARNARHAARAKLAASDEAGVIADLRAVGVFAESVYDFVGKRRAPIAAFAVLIRHLDEKHLPNIREGLIRALGLPEARDVAFDRLCVAYREENDPTLRWVIANALSGMARLEELSELPHISLYAGLFAK